ncbi:MAG: hypothetical protein NC548_62145 [Lachnospiraceae bacterium]|nr:hypothetical protein [Lachnospiraceae bacterium]
MKNRNENERPITENKVNLNWGIKEILGVKIDNLQMSANQMNRELWVLNQHRNMFADKERRTPHLYASVIVEDTSDFHNFNGDDKTHERAEMDRIKFLREVAQHLLVYCEANESEKKE